MEVDNLGKCGSTLPTEKSNYSNLKVLCWNINNVTSTVFGNKLSNREFLAKVKNFHIVCIVETHANKGDELSIEGFRKPFQINRVKKGKNLWRYCNIFEH